MYSHQIEQLADQRQAELHARSAQRGYAGRARPVHLGHQDPTRRRQHTIRRRTGYALISIGLRLAYLAGED
jgi:hypothetical protein